MAKYTCSYEIPPTGVSSLPGAIDLPCWIANKSFSPNPCSGLEQLLYCDILCYFMHVPPSPTVTSVLGFQTLHYLWWNDMDKIYLSILSTLADLPSSLTLPTSLKPLRNHPLWSLHWCNDCMFVASRLVYVFIYECQIQNSFIWGEISFTCICQSLDHLEQRRFKGSGTRGHWPLLVLLSKLSLKHFFLPPLTLMLFLSFPVRNIFYYFCWIYNLFSSCRPKYSARVQ